MDDASKTNRVHWRRANDAMPFPPAIDRLGLALAEVETAVSMVAMELAEVNRLPQSRKGSAIGAMFKAVNVAEVALTKAQDAIPGVAAIISSFVDGRGPRWTSDLKQALANMRGMLLSDGGYAVSMQNEHWRAAAIEVRDKRCLLANADYSAVSVVPVPAASPVGVAATPLAIASLASSVDLHTAFGRFKEVFDAVTLPVTAGGRRVPDDFSANALNGPTNELNHALAREAFVMLQAVGPNDPLLNAAVIRAIAVTAYSAEQHNSGRVGRFQADDVIGVDDLTALDSVGRMLALISPPTQSPKSAADHQMKPIAGPGAKTRQTRNRKRTRHGLRGPSQRQIEAKKLKDAGLTLEQVAAELGIASAGAVSELLSRHDAAMDRVGRSAGRSIRPTHSLDAGDDLSRD